MTDAEDVDDALDRRVGFDRSDARRDDAGALRIPTVAVASDASGDRARSGPRVVTAIYPPAPGADVERQGVAGDRERLVEAAVDRRISGQQENGASGSTGEGLIRHASGTLGSALARLGSQTASASPQPESARRAPRPPVYPNGSGPPARCSPSVTALVRRQDDAERHCSVGRVDLNLHPVLLVRPQRNGTAVHDRDRPWPVPRHAPTRGRRDAEPPASARVNGLSVSAVFQTTHLAGSHPVPGARPSSDTVPIHCRAVRRGRRAMAVTGPGMRSLPRDRVKAVVGPLRGSNLHREPGRAHGPALAGWSWSAARRQDRHGRRSAETRS